mgnify:FL=1
MNNIALVVNTISKNSDIWKMFFDQLEKYTPNDFFTNKYLFTDKTGDDVPEDFKVVLYDESKMYREQFLTGIKEVKEDYCIYISEDYILYNNIEKDLLLKYRDVMENDGISFIKLFKGSVIETPLIQYKDFDDLYVVNKELPYYYSQSATLWKTRDLEKIHEDGPNLHIANTDWQNSFEWNANDICLKLGFESLFVFRKEARRGMYHYDSSVFPHIATALVKGKWNTKEYPNELLPLIEKYNINIGERGEY